MNKNAFTPLRIRSVTGFTLMELMIATVILAILAGAAVMYGARPLETVKGRDARQTLRAIYVAEKEYCIHNGFYANVATLVNEKYLFALNYPTNPDQRDWTYTATPAGGGTPNNCGAFAAQATRTAGRYAGQFISIDNTGQINRWGTDTWVPW